MVRYEMIGWVRSMFTGVITALVTPLRNGVVDEEALRRLVDEQIARRRRRAGAGGDHRRVAHARPRRAPAGHPGRHRAGPQARAGHRRHRRQLDPRGDRALARGQEPGRRRHVAGRRPTTTSRPRTASTATSRRSSRLLRCRPWSTTSPAAPPATCCPRPWPACARSRSWSRSRRPPATCSGPRRSSPGWAIVWWCFRATTPPPSRSSRWARGA